MLFEKINKVSRDIVFVYTTCSGMEEARSIGLSAIKNKLAISADYWPVNSVYPWKGVIQEIDQYMTMFATQKDLSEELIKHIEENHSYSIPMIIRTETSLTNKPYSFWVEDNLLSSEKYITEEEERMIKKHKSGEFEQEKLK